MVAALNAQNDKLDTSQALGLNVRNLRKSRGLTLAELSLKIGRSVGFVSQVERGLSSPSIEDLRAITTALDVPVSWFFVNENVDEAERGLIVRAAMRRSLGTKESGLTEELLSPDIGGSFEMFRSVFEPGSESSGEILRDTEEAGVIVSGQLDLWIDGTLFNLHKGDSFRFDRKPYRWRNSGSKPAVVIWALSPPVY